MKRSLLTVVLLSAVLFLNAQKEKYISMAVYSTQNDMPFGKFAGLFGEIIHPGFELGYGKMISKKNKHEWFGDLRLSYFYHRQVQHGIPLSANLGYRHKLVKELSAEVMVGLGYLHSIPTTGKFALNNEGQYENNKGIGRMQGTANLSIGLSYLLIRSADQPVRLFTIYQQRLQTPFVKSYVPLLPYNSLMIGFSRTIKTNPSSSK